MKEEKKNTTEIQLRNEDFKKGHDFITAFLERNGISDVMVSQTMVIFEALFNDLILKGYDPETTLKLRGRNTLGEVGIVMSFEGDIYIPEEEVDDFISPEASILNAYGDSIDYSYLSGYNKIILTVRRSQIRAVMPSLLSILIALIAYIPVSAYLDPAGEEYLLEQIVFPSEILFGNAILMVGAPVTFLSLLKNFTDSYIISERHSDFRSLRTSIMLSTLVVLALSVAISFVAVRLTGGFNATLADYRGMRVDLSMREAIMQMMPDNIFAPFETLSPFPLIILAGIVTYAFCSAGRYFDRMKEAVDIAYVLFSRMLSIVMFVLPLFTFAAVFDLLLSDGFASITFMGEMISTVYLSMIAVTVLYLARLKLSGVEAKGFIKKIVPQLQENLKINSAIDAVPFNIRYCTRVFGLDRKRLESELPVLAQINLNGNCFIITLVTMFIMLASGTHARWVDIIVITILVLFLSLGAPNQPGSCLIGLLITLNYLNGAELIALAVFAEVFFGSLQNLMNVAGDIVTVNILDKKRRN